MSGSEWEILGVVSAGLVLVVLPVTVGTYRRLKAARSVVCPRTARVAGVKVDAVAAAVGSAFDRLPLRVTSCSLWPEKRGCGQECVGAFRER